MTTIDQIKKSAIETAMMVADCRHDTDTRKAMRDWFVTAIDAYEAAMWSKSMRGAPDEVILVESKDGYGEWSVDPAIKIDARKWETIGGTILNKPRRYRPLPQPPEVKHEPA